MKELKVLREGPIWLLLGEEFSSQGKGHWKTLIWKCALHAWKAKYPVCLEQSEGEKAKRENTRGEIPGWLSGLAPAFRPGRDPGVPRWESCIESLIGLPAWSLLLPLPVSLPLSLSLCVSHE